MIPYPASGGDADRVAKLDENGMLAAIAASKGQSLPGEYPEAPPCEKTGSATDDLPPVWKRYVDSRLKQFCTR